MKENQTSARLRDETVANQWAITLLRCAVATIIGIHGVARALNDAVAPFGEWLQIQGFPFGDALAVLITTVEILAAVLFVANRMVLVLAPVLVTIYAVGVVLVHAPVGWFVVGLGRNGAEFSFLLMVGLLAIWLPALAKWAAKRSTARQK